MENLNINSYLGKSTGDQITASMWNELFAEIQDKINEIVAKVSGTTPGGDEPTPGPGTGGDEPTPQEGGFFVNGVKQTSNVITLPAGASYKLSGKLEGQVIIDAESAKPLGNTNVVLDNVEIVSNENYAIKYATPQSNKGYKDLVITLAKDSKNYVVCTKSVAIEDDQPGAIYSMNNLVIQGVGALAISNNGGHGVRATEVNIIGPYMYIQATHDGIHGKKIKAIYGQFKFNNVKDGFGTGEDGSLLVGKIECQFSNVRGSNFHIKGNTLYLTIGFENTADSNSTTMTAYGITFDQNNDPVQRAEGQVTVAADKDSDPTIITKDGNNEYIIPDNLPYITATGAIEGNIVIPETFTNGVDSAVTLNLEDAIIFGAVIFNPGSDNIKVVSKKDTVNIIAADEDNAIKSENNIKLELKNNSVLYITSKFDGIDGGDVTITDSKGVLLVTDCGERGIKGNAIVIGPSAEITKSVITSYVTDPASLDYTDLEGAVVVVDNCKDVQESFIDGTSEVTVKATGYADIFARQGKKVTKGVFGTRDAQLNGPLIVGSIGATIGCDFDNARMLYYDRLIEGTNVTNDPGTISTETGMTEFVPAITINPIDNSQLSGDNTGGEQGGTEEQTPTYIKVATVIPEYDTEKPATVVEFNDDNGNALSVENETIAKLVKSDEFLKNKYDFNKDGSFTGDDNQVISDAIFGRVEDNQEYDLKNDGETDTSDATALTNIRNYLYNTDAQDTILVNSSGPATITGGAYEIWVTPDVKNVVIKNPLNVRGSVVTETQSVATVTVQ